MLIGEELKLVWEQQSAGVWKTSHRHGGIHGVGEEQTFTYDAVAGVLSADYGILGRKLFHMATIVEADQAIDDKIGRHITISDLLEGTTRHPQTDSPTLEDEGT